MKIFCAFLSLCLFGMAVGPDITAAGENAEIPATQNLARGNFHHAVFSGDGKRLLTATDGVSQLWDVATGQLVRQFDSHIAPIHGIRFSPDERRILTAAGDPFIYGPEDPTARLWDIATGKQLAVFDSGQQSLADNQGEHRSAYVISAEFSPDGKRIVSVCKSKSSVPSVAAVWEIASAKVQFAISRICPFSDCTHAYESVKFGPAGDVLAGLVRDGKELNLWDGKTGRLRWKVDGDDFNFEEGQLSRFGSVEFSPSGKLLIAACSDKRARIWTVSDGRQVRVLKGHTDEVWWVRFTADGKQVMTSSKDGTVRLWDTESGRQTKQFDHSGPIHNPGLNSDDSRLITTFFKRSSTDEAHEKQQPWAALWNVHSGQKIKEYQLSQVHFRYSPFTPDGSQILIVVPTPPPTSGAAREKPREIAVHLIDVRTGATIHEYD